MFIYFRAPEVKRNRIIPIVSNTVNKYKTKLTKILISGKQCKNT